MITDAGLIGAVRELVKGAIYFAWIFGIGRAVPMLLQLVPYFFPQKPQIIDLQPPKPDPDPIPLPDSDADRGPIQ